MEGGIAILLILIVLVVAAVVGLVLYLSGASIAARQGGPAAAPPDPIERRVSQAEAERQLTPETRRERRRRGRAAG